jgi:hypothetical protein
MYKDFSLYQWAHKDFGAYASSDEQERIGVKAVGA